MKNDTDRNKAKKPCLLMGLGHTGCRVLESLARLKGYGGIECMAIDTDAADLQPVEALKIQTILLGQEAVGGHGTGGDHEQAMHIMKDASELLERTVAGHQMLIVVASLGGGTGSAVEEILCIADELMIPTALLAVMPFSFESAERRMQAEELLSQMDMHCQVLVRVPNDRLLAQFSSNSSVDAFGRASDYLAKAAVCIATPFSSQNLFNVEPAIFNSLSAQDGNPRCFLAHVVCGSADEIKGLRDSLARQYVFEEDQIRLNADRALVLLRVSANCREEEMEFAISQAAGMLPDAVVDVAACMDGEMEEYVSMTVLLHLASSAYSDEDAPEDGGAEAEPQGVLPEESTVKPKGGRGKNMTERQLQIPFLEDELGIFAGDPENDWNGSNIDIPAFRRQKCTIDKGT